MITVRTRYRDGEFKMEQSAFGYEFSEHEWEAYQHHIALKRNWHARMREIDNALFAKEAEDFNPPCGRLRGIK